MPSQPNVLDYIKQLEDRIGIVEKTALSLSEVYPVGSIYVNATNSTNPETLLGFGTWSAFGAGKVMTGYNSGDDDFNSAEKTGGAKTHKHKGYGDADSGETSGDLRATIGSPSGDASRLGFIATNAVNPNTGSSQGNYTYSVPGSASGFGSNGSFSHYTQVVGYTSTKSSLQPYITCYFWKRTA